MIILFTIALIGIIALVSLSSTEYTNNDLDIIDIEEIHTHPNRYLEKEITVKGIWHEAKSPYYNSTIIENGAVLYIKSFNVSNEIILINGGEYIFTGNLRIEEIYYQDSYIIDVTNIRF